MRQHVKRRLPPLIILIVLLACIAPFAYPHLALRFYMQRTLSSIPLPPNTEPLTREYVVEPQCRWARVWGYYQTDMSRDDILAFYNAYVENTPFWRVPSDDLQKQRSLIVDVNLNSSSFRDATMQKTIQKAPANGKVVFGILFNYVENMDLYKKSDCFTD